MVDHLDDRRFSSQTIKAIRIIVGKKGLVQPFRASDVNVALGIDWAGHFLPKTLRQATRQEDDSTL
jgi:hypothetical protein